MKTWIPLTLALAVVLFGAPLLAEEADGVVTLSGDLVCAKCTLNLEGFEKCQDVLVVEGEDGEESLYFVTANEIAKEAGHTCEGKKAVKMKGTLAEADGKTWITPSKIKPAEA